MNVERKLDFAFPPQCPWPLLRSNMQFYNEKSPADDRHISRALEMIYRFTSIRLIVD
jgi:hypothetical protein